MTEFHFISVNRVIIHMINFLQQNCPKKGYPYSHKWAPRCMWVSLTCSTAPANPHIIKQWVTSVNTREWQSSAPSCVCSLCFPSYCSHMSTVYTAGSMNKEPGDVQQCRKWALSHHKCQRPARSPSNPFGKAPQRNKGQTFLRMTVISILDLCNSWHSGWSLAKLSSLLQISAAEWYSIGQEQKSTQMFKFLMLSQDHCGIFWLWKGLRSAFNPALCNHQRGKLIPVQSSSREAALGAARKRICIL